MNCGVGDPDPGPVFPGRGAGIRLGAGMDQSPLSVLTVTSSPVLG